jgi:uncharacterized protein
VTEFCARLRSFSRLALATLLVACGPRAEAPGDPPAADRLVDDRAGIVAPASEARLERLLAAVRADTGVELRVATLPSLGGEAIGARAEALFERWRVGAGTRGGRGLLLVVAPRERQARLVVGYALEAHFPDGFVAYVEREQLAQYFARGAVGEGVEATVEMLARRAEEEIAGGELDPGAGDVAEGGPLAGGAGAAVALDAGRPEPEPAPDVAAALGERFAAQPTPELAWERFLEIQRRRVKAVDLGLYDPAAREILRARPNSDAAQDHLAKLYGGRAYEVREADDRAVIRFADDPRHLLAPWLWRRADEGWQLDGAAVRELVRYNHLNQWRFARLDHDYMFAFDDYAFDAHGFGRRR